MYKVVTPLSRSEILQMVCALSQIKIANNIAFAYVYIFEILRFFTEGSYRRANNYSYFRDRGCPIFSFRIEVSLLAYRIRCIRVIPTARVIPWNRYRIREENTSSFSNPVYGTVSRERKRERKRDARAHRLDLKICRDIDIRVLTPLLYCRSPNP